MFKSRLNISVIWTVFIVSLHIIAFSYGVIWPILLVGVSFGLFALGVHINDTYPQVLYHIIYPCSYFRSDINMEAYIAPSLVSSVLLTEFVLLTIFC